MAGSVRVVGLGGSLRAASTSRTALQAALEGAAGKGADTQLIWVRDLDLPLPGNRPAPLTRHATSAPALGFKTCSPVRKRRALPTTAAASARPASSRSLVAA
jgi:hypothetical protein